MKSSRFPHFLFAWKGEEKGAPAAALLETPSTFRIFPEDIGRQSVPMLFSQRGVYRQEAFRIVTRFPFGFLQKARRIDLARRRSSIPPWKPRRNFWRFCRHSRSGGKPGQRPRQDLYALRDYMPNDSARHVHWKASARTGVLMVREFAREDDYRVLLVFDPYSPRRNPILPRTKENASSAP